MCNGSLRQVFNLLTDKDIGRSEQDLLQHPQVNEARRWFLSAGTGAVVALAATGLPFSARAAISLPIHERKIKLVNRQTGETLETIYFQDGAYLEEPMTQINRLMRDHHSGAVTKIDPNLLDLLVKVEALLDRKGEITVTSAYRTARTNRRLRSEGAAKQSMHVKGQAVDIRMPGIHLKALRDLATALRAGGVGYYPRSNFVHLDTGNIRYW